MGVALAARPRSQRPTVAALVLVVALLIQMALSLAFPATVPRLVVLPRPGPQTAVVVDGCGTRSATTSCSVSGLSVSEASAAQVERSSSR